jgi:glucose/arabinose dehydrogenase
MPHRSGEVYVPLRYVLLNLLIFLAVGCSTTEEQPLPVPVDHVTSTVPSPNAAEVSLLPGYRAEVVVSLLNYPSSITFDPMGNLYVAESGAAPGDESRPPRILRIAPGGQIDIMSDKVHTPVKELQWHDGRLFVWHGEKISTIDHEGQLRDAKSDSAPPSGRFQEQITDATSSFGRPDQILRIVPPTRDHGGQVLRVDPKSRRSSVFFCARVKEKEPSIGAGAGPRRPVDLAFSSDGRALYIVDFGATLMTRSGFHSFPETGVIWRIVKDGTTVTSPPPNLAPPPQIERRPVTSISKISRID